MTALEVSVVALGSLAVWLMADSGHARRRLRWLLPPRSARARARPRRGDQSAAMGDLPIAIDLIVAGLRAGGTMPDVLGAVGTAVTGPLGRALDDAGRQLRLGADPAAVWADGPTELAAVGRGLARSADTGAPIADILERHATDLRRAGRTRATARLQRLGVWVAAPLGLCFLPAFVLIGIVPLAAGLLSELTLP